MTGYGVINIEGNHPRCLEYGGVSGLTKGGSNLFPDRLRRIHTKLHALLEHHAPDVVAVEDVFYAVNVKSALKLGQARGVV